VETPIDKPPSIEDLTPAQRLVALQALRDMNTGKIETPRLRCGKCSTTAVVTDGENRRMLRCMSCGALTDTEAAHRIRRQEIRRLIYEIGRGEGRVFVRRRRLPDPKP
jgi:hypothetical protein